MSVTKLIFNVSIVCVLGTALFLLLSLVWNLLVVQVATAIGIGPENLSSLLLALGFLIIFMPKHYFRIRRPTTMSATQIIFAPIEEVWDQVMPRARTDHFLPSTPVIKPVEGDDTLFEYIIPAAHNGPMKGQIKLRNRVVEKSAPHYLALFLENGADVKSVGIDAESSEYLLEVVDSDTTRVTFKSTVSHISPLFLITLLFVHPIRDTLRRLKSVCEGTPDISWVGKISTALETGQQSEINRNARVIMITVTVVLTAILFGVFGIVMTMLPNT